jgi:hypothetical protein
MTEKQARTVANALMATAALGAAVLVLRSPRVRRVAWQMARQYARGPLAVWAATSVREAWDGSASRLAPIGATAARPR